MALAQVGMDTVMSAVRVSKQAYEQFGKINVYAGIAAAVAAAGIVTASGVAQSAKIANMKYASGTQFAQGGYARVGENGPEDMYVPRGAMITNNRETRYNNTTNATTLNVTIIDQSGSVIDRTTRQIRDGSADDLVRAITEKAARL
jgi:SLT domain-containing protein